MSDSLTFERLATANVNRALRWHPGGLDEWSVSDWLLAMCGEAGEAANAGKKLKRLMSGIQQHGNTPADLEAAIDAVVGELADTVIYADLCCTRVGRTLADAIVSKFNAISEREGFPERLRPESDEHSMTLGDALRRNYASITEAMKGGGRPPKPKPAPANVLISEASQRQEEL